MPAAVDEMASTPTSQSAALDANDKKRNKLGYHRTSVACGQYQITLPLSVVRRYVDQERETLFRVA
jgi:hypothetical protein